MVTPWLVTRGSESSRARLRLVAVPYAGAGASAFLPWTQLLPPDIELAVVRMPGRENRYREKRLTDMDDVVDQLQQAVSSTEPALPIAIFGYSLGSLIAYELAIRLHATGAGPILLAVGGSDAPHAPHPSLGLYNLDDDAFVAAIRALGGTPDEVFEHAELLKLLLPILRADFELLDGYRSSAHPPLDCPLVTYQGDSDSELTHAGMAAWAELSTGPHTARHFAGGHFFFVDDPDLLARRLAADVRAAARIR